MPTRTLKLVVKRGKPVLLEGIGRIIEPRLCNNDCHNHDYYTKASFIPRGSQPWQHKYHISYELGFVNHNKCKSITDSLRGAEVCSVSMSEDDRQTHGLMNLNRLLWELIDKKPKSGTYLMACNYDSDSRHQGDSFGNSDIFWGGELYEVNLDSPYAANFLLDNETALERAHDIGEEMVKEVRSLMGISPSDPAMIKAIGTSRELGMCKEELEAYKREILVNPERLFGQERLNLINAMRAEDIHMAQAVTVSQEVLDNSKAIVMDINSSWYYMNSYSTCSWLPEAKRREIAKENEKKIKQRIKTDSAEVKNILRTHAQEADLTKEPELIVQALALDEAKIMEEFDFNPADDEIDEL